MISRSENMRRIKSKGMFPERSVKKILKNAGVKFVMNLKALPGKPDFVIDSQKMIIFVHGCFWHQHKGCKDGRMPKTKLSYWKPKLENNVKRDMRTKRLLRKKGWRVLTLWECQIVKNPGAVKKKIGIF